VDGVRARLIATPSPNHQTALDLELQNVSDVGNPIEIWYQDMSLALPLELETAAGPVEHAGTGASITMPPPYWLELPGGSTLRIPITRAAYEDDPGQPALFRPIEDQAWEVPAAPLFLRGTFAPRTAPDERGHTAWHGPLALPRIALPPR
jgi:hypothetical protein